MTPFVLPLLAKLTVILVLGLGTAATLRSFSPSLRHLALFATLVSGLTLPLVMLVSPTWTVTLLPPSVTPLMPSSAADRQSPPRTIQTTSAGVANARLQSGVVDPQQSTPSSVPTAPLVGARSANALDPRGIVAGLQVSLVVWALGFVAVILWLTIGRVRLARIARGSWSLTSPEWRAILDRECKYARVTKPVLLYSSSVVSTPLTWGSRTPIVLLPEDAVDWPEEHRRIVLRHELAHVARGDSSTQLVAGLACALYWFHPLVWVVERRLRAECERACDDSVVSLGTPAAEYAAHLLEVARSARAFGAPGFLSVAMARPSQLEGRLLAVLNESRRRVSLSRRARPAAASLSLLVVIPVAAFRAVPKIGPAPRSVTEKYSAIRSNESTRPPASAASPIATTVADSTLQLSIPARRGGTLFLDLRTGGRVVVNGWDKPQIFVRASLGGRDWRATRVTLTPEDGDARLESTVTGYSSNQSTRHVFEISVPRNYNLRLSSAGGSVSVNGVDGSFTGHTGGGEINIEKSSGEAEMQTGGGDIYVRDSRLSGSLSTGGGVVRIIGNTGDLSGKSGSGPVVYSTSATNVTKGNGVSVVGVPGADNAYTLETGSGSGSGAGRGVSTSSVSVSVNPRPGAAGTASAAASRGITMTSAGGSLSLPSAPNGARVTTGGGSIRIGRAGGEVYAQTGGGPIDVGPASGSVQAHTGGGDVTIELTGAGTHSVDVTSGKGQVMLVVPRDLNATLELETAYTNNLGHKTRIVSDLPLQITETPDWDASEGTPRRYVRVHQTVGLGGGVIRVRTVNGDIVINRAR